MRGTHGIKLWAKAFVFLLVVTECVRFLFGFVERLWVEKPVSYLVKPAWIISSGYPFSSVLDQGVFF